MTIHPPILNRRMQQFGHCTILCAFDRTLFDSNFADSSSHSVRVEQYNKEQGNGLTMLTISATVLLDLCFTEYDRLGLSKADVMTTKSVKPRISTTSLIVPIVAVAVNIKNGVVG